MIVEYTNKVLLTDKERDPREPSIYWPSQASITSPNGKVIGACLRQIYYNIGGIPQTNPSGVRFKRIMLLGKKIEEAELGLLKESGVLLAEQVTFETHHQGITIRGKIDGICNPENNIIGLEIKTGGGYYFKNEIFGTETITPTPKIPNLLQVMLYLDGFANHEQYQFNKCILYYIDRETCDTQEFVITLDAGFACINGQINYALNVQDIYKRYMTLDGYIKNATLPPMDYRNLYTMDEAKNMYRMKMITKSKYTYWEKMGYGADFECDYCNWKDKCKKDCQLI